MLLLNLLTTAISPARCLVCTDIIQNTGLLCSSCWNNIHFIYDNCCIYCGFPANKKATLPWVCNACAVAQKPIIARSAFVYDKTSKNMITKFKFSGQAQIAKRLSKFIIHAGRNIIEGIDIIVPTPVHFSTLIHRKYNQSALLALHLSKHYKIPGYCDALIKIKHTQPQSSLTCTRRLKNLHNAFRARDTVKDKTVLLVDDVITTGVTVKECCKALRKAGAREVRAVSLARAILY